jgi:Cys-rich protein (TIGR01571 family)
MGRLRLSVMTDRAVSLNSRMRVKTVHFFTMGLVAFNSFSLAFVIKTPHLPLAILVLAMLVVIQVPILFYFVFQVFRTRKRIRKTYHIPETSCEGCEDLLVSVWCTPLALAQMGRHTADYEKYRAFWCSDTGLPNDIEVVLPKV